MQSPARSRRSFTPSRPPWTTLNELVYLEHFWVFGRDLGQTLSRVGLRCRACDFRLRRPRRLTRRLDEAYCWRCLTHGKSTVSEGVNAGSRKFPLLDQVIKPVRDLLVRNQFWRTVIIACKLRDVSAVRLLSAFCAATNGKISDVFRS